MKTTEQMVQIRTLKSLIAELVESHKSTKNEFGRNEKYLYERQHLFVIYTAYYILRHSIEDKESYIADVFSKLRQDKQNRNYRFKFFGFEAPITCRWGKQYVGDLNEAVDACISCLNQYIEKNGDTVE